MRPRDRSRFLHAGQGDHEGATNEERGKHDAASGGQALRLERNSRRIAGEKDR